MSITVYVDDMPVKVAPGENLAGFLLNLDGKAVRKHPVDGSARTPFCLIGTCFECLVEIDDIPNQQACLHVTRNGMRIKRGLAA